MLPCILHKNAICLVSVIPFSISVHGFPRRASAASEKKNFGVYRDFGQCTGEIGAPYRDMTQIVWQVCKCDVGVG